MQQLTSTYNEYMQQLTSTYNEYMQLVHTYSTHS